MERWQNKVAVVTGASSGIGATVAADLVKNGFKVVGFARREDRLRENKQALPPEVRDHYYPIKCDVTKEDEVKSAFAWITNSLGGTDVLINNAGLVRRGADLTKMDSSQALRDVIETNIMAVTYCVREAFNSMKTRRVDGHVVIINSIVGHKVPVIPGLSNNIYPPSKFAVTAMVETYRQEFAIAGTKVKVTSISPGVVETEMIPELKQLTEAPHLVPADISNAILYVLSTPPHVQIHELTIKPVGEKF